MVWDINAKQGNESAKVKYDIVKYTRGTGLDIGCGMYKPFIHFIGVDSGKQWEGMTQGEQLHYRLNANIMREAEHLDLFFAKQSMDFVFSSHLLEHIDATRKTLTQWWRLIKNDGYLILYLPHADFYPKVGEPGANEDHKHDFRPRDIIEHMKEIGCWDLVVNEERNEGNEYSFLQVYQKRSLKENVHSWALEKPKKTCCVVRFGAFGDQIQASSILPVLKDQGYHVTFMTTDTGYEILKHDPNVDDWVILQTDQVPNEELVPFWTHTAKKFDKFINLSESVEGTLLSQPGRPSFYWSQQVRHQTQNHNYLEFTHQLAGVPFKPNPRFYPTEREVKRAERRLQRIGDNVILWVLDGSSVHKHYPYMDNVIARILMETDYKIVTVGNEMSAILETGWEDEPRVIRKSGVWSIRETLTFAQQCAMVIGPETGVMNSVSFEDVPKILFLSHSTAENISKHWVNCVALEAPHGCRQCHKMIFGFENCSRATMEWPLDDGRVIILDGAECQMNITPDMFWEAFNIHVRQRKAA